MFNILKLTPILCCFLLAACSGNKAADTGISVEVIKEQRQKNTPEQAVVSKHEVSLAPAYFEFDKADLSQEAKSILTQNIAAMKNAKQIIIIGRCDNRGTEKRNKTLARKRADIVKDFYIAQGINPARITAYINLKEQNICAKTDEPCHAKNRKTDSVIKLR
jgi:outer membrane protein OmpA-like peptidoglycan-associated protein